MKPDSVESRDAGACRPWKRRPAATAPYRLVLIDGNMPEMDGFQLAECIKRNPKLIGRDHPDAERRPALG